MIKQKTLANGVRIIVDEMQDVASCTTSIGFGTGSMNETKKQNGISHFLEHMAFKGTKTRSAYKIAYEVDCFGGAMNAFTSYDKTVYYIKSQAQHLEKSVDILADILLNSTFDETELERERGVILQELSASLDTPDDVIFDIYKDAAFGDTSLGRTILGPEENIKSFSRQELIDYFENQYTSQNMVFSVAGNVKAQDVFALAEKYFGQIPNKKPKQPAQISPYIGGNEVRKKEDLSQVQFILGFETVPLTHEDYYIASVASAILGKGMSSRLFQEVREKHGLCYTIACFYEAMPQYGLFAIYSGTSPQDLSKLEETIDFELQKATTTISNEELSKVLEQYKSGVVFAQESTSGRSQKGISNLLSHQKYITNDEILEKVAKITTNQVQDFIKKTISTKRTKAVYGNV